MIATIGALVRLARAGHRMAREGVFSGLNTAEMPPGPAFGVRIARLFERRRDRDAPRSLRMSRALEKLGPAYIKLGQFLATRPDLVGAEVSAELESLRDRLPPFPQDEAIAVLEDELGAPLGQLFERFDAPIAAASVAQVHRARLPGASEDVAVKILRPGIEARLARDIQAFSRAAWLVETLVPASRRLKPQATVATLARSLELECDLRMEASATSEIGENMAGDEAKEAGFAVPTVNWTRTSKRCMVTTWIDGIPLGNTVAIREAGHDMKALGQTVIRTFLRMAIRDGVFHADMHQGNLFVDGAGRLVAVDFGIVGRLGEAEKRYLAEILSGFITRDYMKVARVHFEAGYVPADQDVATFAQALRAIGEPLQDRRADEIAMGRVLTQLFETTATFGMETQTQLLLLQKTMVVTEGVARTLDPKLDMWRTAEPVVAEWMATRVGPGALLHETATTLQQAARAIGRLPELTTRVEAAAGRLGAADGIGIRLDTETTDKLARAIAKEVVWMRVAVIVGGIGLLVLAGWAVFS